MHMMLQQSTYTYSVCSVHASDMPSSSSPSSFDPFKLYHQLHRPCAPQEQKEEEAQIPCFQTCHASRAKPAYERLSIATQAQTPEEAKQPVQPSSCADSASVAHNSQRVILKPKALVLKAC